ncbi:transmembrane protein [Cystoisospora suis]|uniref:Transmembrane protein n=1 Tax=Cystoisospora suis TaxID=483139 RepID=A0A2C6LBB5_9APIC|nr:transmembrane protein [Cystoisospora suis]
MALLGALCSPSPRSLESPHSEWDPRSWLRNSFSSSVLFASSVLALRFGIAGSWCIAPSFCLFILLLCHWFPFSICEELFRAISRWVSSPSSQFSLCNTVARQHEERIGSFLPSSVLASYTRKEALSVPPLLQCVSSAQWTSCVFSVVSASESRSFLDAVALLSFCLLRLHPSLFSLKSFRLWWPRFSCSNLEAGSSHFVFPALVAGLRLSRLVASTSISLSLAFLLLSSRSSWAGAVLVTSSSPRVDSGVSAGMRSLPASVTATLGCRDPAGSTTCAAQRSALHLLAEPGRCGHSSERQESILSQGGQVAAVAGERAFSGEWSDISSSDSQLLRRDSRIKQKELPDPRASRQPALSTFRLPSRLSGSRTVAACHSSPFNGRQTRMVLSRSSVQFRTRISEWPSSQPRLPGTFPLPVGSPAFVRSFSSAPQLLSSSAPYRPFVSPVAVDGFSGSRAACSSFFCGASTRYAPTHAVSPFLGGGVVKAPLPWPLDGMPSFVDSPGTSPSSGSKPFWALPGRAGLSRKFDGSADCRSSPSSSDFVAALPVSSAGAALGENKAGAENEGIVIEELPPLSFDFFGEENEPPPLASHGYGDSPSIHIPGVWHFYFPRCMYLPGDSGETLGGGLEGDISDQDSGTGRQSTEGTKGEKGLKNKRPKALGDRQRASGGLRENQSTQTPRECTYVPDSKGIFGRKRYGGPEAIFFFEDHTAVIPSLSARGNWAIVDPPESSPLTNKEIRLCVFSSKAPQERILLRGILAFSDHPTISLWEERVQLHAAQAGGSVFVGKDVRAGAASAAAALPQSVQVWDESGNVLLDGDKAAGGRSERDEEPFSATATYTLSGEFTGYRILGEDENYFKVHHHFVRYGPKQLYHLVEPAPAVGARLVSAVTESFLAPKSPVAIKPAVALRSRGKPGTARQGPRKEESVEDPRSSAGDLRDRLDEVLAHFADEDPQTVAWPVPRLPKSSQLEEEDEED